MRESFGAFKKKRFLDENTTEDLSAFSSKKTSFLFCSSLSGMIGKKLGMAQIFLEDGTFVPVTYVLCPPNTVHFVKEDRMVLGGEAKKKPTKTKSFVALREFALMPHAKKGDQVAVDLFENGDLVTVVATSKGQGFTGRIKRHNFKDLRQTHGTKYVRHGSTSFGRNRLRKGYKMAGRSGGDQVTLHNRKVIRVDADRHLIAVLGPIPGAKNGLVLLKKEL